MLKQIRFKTNPYLFKKPLGRGTASAGAEAGSGTVFAGTAAVGTALNDLRKLELVSLDGTAGRGWNVN